MTLIRPDSSPQAARCIPQARLAPEEIFGFDIGEEDPATAGRYRLVTDEDEILGTRSRRKTVSSAIKVRMTGGGFPAFRLTTQEDIMDENSWFYEWRKPTEFLQRRTKLSQGVDDADHRTQGNKWSREAWVLGLFAVGTDATDLRLVEKDQPDGEVQLAGRIVPIEIVEAFEEGRQPDKEFKTGQRKHVATIAEQDEELGLIKCTIERTIRKKERGNYSNETVLVVYLNMGNDTRIPPSDVFEVVRAASDQTSSKFAAICILWRIWLFGPTSIVKNGRVTIDWQLFED